MADRAAWERLRLIAVARVRQAEVAHGRARRDATEAEAARTRADAALADAVDAWRQQMDGFDPVLGALHARALTDRADEHDRAGQAHAAADDATRHAAEAWRREDARGQAVDTEADRVARQARYRAEERALMAMADREALRWTRR